MTVLQNGEFPQNAAQRPVPLWLEKLSCLCSSKAFLISMFLVLCGYLAYGCTREISIFDEGIITCQAESILHGAIPYRDFWSVYGPGQFYLVAFMFKLFGPSLLVGRIYSVILLWAITLVSYGIARLLAGAIGGAAACVTVALWLAFDRMPLYPAVPALMFGLIGLWVVAQFSPSWRRNLIAGLLMGCCALTRHDLGVYGYLSVFFLIFVRTLFVRSSNLNPHFLGDVPKQLLIYSCGFSLVVLPVLVALMVTVPHHQLYETFVDYPFHIYSRYRSVPFPLFQYVSSMRHDGRLTTQGLAITIKSCLQFGVPPAIAIAAFLVCIQPSTVRKKPQGFLLGIAVMIFDAGIWYSVKVRPDIWHMVTPGVISLILFPWLVRLVVTLDVNLPLRLLSGSLIIATVASLSLYCVYETWLSPWLHGARYYPLEIDRAKGISVTMNAETIGLVDAVRFIRDRVPPSEPLFVGNARHDRFVSNAAMIYFLSARNSASRYSELEPGIATTASAQLQIVSELTTRNVKYIVLWTKPQWIEPNLSSQSDSKTLDQFIHSHYTRLAEFGCYSILYRPASVSDVEKPSRQK